MVKIVHCDYCGRPVCTIEWLKEDGSMSTEQMKVAKEAKKNCVCGCGKSGVKPLMG